MRNEEEISDEELNAFTDAVKKRYGIDFTNYETKSLKRGIARVITKHNMGSLLGMWGKVLKDKQYFIDCMDDLTVNLTELFRNPEIWIKLRDEILNDFRLKNKIKIWHAGCSTGEEVYTMAVVLNDVQMLQKADAFASDLSATALSIAISGKYPLILKRKYLGSFDKYAPKVTFEDVFDTMEDSLVVNPKFKAHVVYKQHNLVTDSMTGTFDLIFCRNVMIYFDEALKMKVLKQFYDSLSDDGYFIIGYYDMLPDKSKTLFEPVDSKTRIYRKKKPVDLPEKESASSRIKRTLKEREGANVSEG